MNLSAKSEYACVALLELAKQFGSTGPLQAKVICERHDIPSRFLVQILLQLKGAGLVISTRGAAGGYRLAHDPAEIKLADVFLIVEGPREEADPSTEASWATRAVRGAWFEAHACQQQALEAITLADLLADAPVDDDGMYYI